MAVAARKLSAGEAGVYLSIEEAAKESGLSERSVRRYAERHAAIRAASGRGSLAVKQRSGWIVHRDLLKRIAGNATSEKSMVVKWGLDKTDTACTKKDWVQRWEQRCREHPGHTREHNAAFIIKQAKSVHGTEFEISFRSLQNWRTMLKRHGLEAVRDRRGESVAGGGCHPERDPEATYYFYSLYHAPNQRSVKWCHDQTWIMAAKENWYWPESAAATRKWLDKYDDLGRTCLAREGWSAYSHRFMPHIESDVSHLEPGAFYVADHHQMDVWAEYKGEQIRPWLTAVQDRKSRCIVGWHVGPTPHSEAIISALRMAFRDWSIPTKMRPDNGKDFTSKLLTGITKHDRDALRRQFGKDFWSGLERDKNIVTCADPEWKGITGELGVEIVYAKPFSAWAKGTIERWFGTLADQCCKNFATYCGRSSLHKPDCLEAIRRGYTDDQKRYHRKRYGKDWKKVVVLKQVDQRDVPTLDEVREAVGKFIAIYHARPHSAEDMAALSPLEMWNTATTLRRADENELLMLMQCKGVYTVGPNGVRVQVGGGTHGYGQGHPALIHRKGRKVLVVVDPDRSGECYVFTPERDNRRYIATLLSNERIPVDATDEILREASRGVSRCRKDMQQYERSAPKRMRRVAQEARALMNEEHAWVQKTGTYGGGGHDITPVRTPIEPRPKAVREAVEEPADDCPDASQILKSDDELNEDYMERQQNQGGFGDLSDD